MYHIGLSERAEALRIVNSVEGRGLHCQAKEGKMVDAQMVKVIVQDATGLKQSPIELPDDIPISVLIPVMVAKLNQPVARKGWPLLYELDNGRAGKRLRDEDTLASAGVESDDILILHPWSGTVSDQPEDLKLLYGGSAFRDVATIITVIVQDRPIALAVPRQGTVANLGEFLRRRLAALSPSVNLPSSFRLLHEGREGFLKEEESVGELISDQDVISVHEVIKIEEL